MLLTSWIQSLRNSRVSSDRVRRSRNPRRRETAAVVGRSANSGVEQLEDRTLLSGPTLLTIGADVGDFVTDGQIRHESPRALTFQFGPGQTIDTATLDAIRVYRAGHDDTFNPASAVSDLNTAGAVQLQFEAARLGADANGTAVVFLTQDFGGPALPVVSTLGSQVVVTLNTNDGRESTAQEVVSAINSDPDASAVLKASIAAGSGATNVADTTGEFLRVELGGGSDVRVVPGFVGIGEEPNRVLMRFKETLPDDLYRIEILGETVGAAAVSDFNTAGEAVIGFRARQPGPAGNGITINVEKDDAGGPALPTISVAGNTITVELNTNDGNESTADDVLTAINGHAGASALVIASLVAGDGETVVATPAITYSPIVLGGATALPLTDAAGDAFNDANDTFVDFTLDLGAQVVAVVPQPVRRLMDGTLEQRRDQVEVYFNRDALDQNSAENPKFYQLIDTVFGTDILHPISVVYEAAENKATLTFASDIGEGTYRLRIGTSNEQDNTLATATEAGRLFNLNQFQTTSVIGEDQGYEGQGVDDVDLYRFHTGAGNLTVSVAPTAGLDTRLRVFDASGVEIGSIDAAGGGVVDTLNLLGAPGGVYYVGVSAAGNNIYDPTDGSGAAGGATSGSYTLTVQTTAARSTDDDNSSFGTATDLGIIGRAGQSIFASISAQSLMFPVYPGGNDEPGHRDIPPEDHFGHAPGQGVSSTNPDAILIQEYNFKDIYGRDPLGNLLQNAITENQKQRAREIFEIYGNYLGVQFKETPDSGFAIVTGDVRAHKPTIPASTPGDAYYVEEFGFSAIMNAGRDYGASEYGGEWFRIALHEIGHLLGVIHSYDIPSVMGSGSSGAPGEAVFPGHHDLVHLQRLHRPDSTDIDMYRVEVPEGGRLTAEINAERRATDSQLDAVFRLYREEMTPGGPVRTLVAQNDDYYSDDSFLDLALEPGIYYIGVSSVGNTDYNPTVSDTGFGGRTTGDYNLDINFSSAPSSSLVDATGTAFDGDADGIAGGVYDFWFDSGETIFVDKAAPDGGDGSLAQPFNAIDDALVAVTGTTGIIRIVGNGGADGDLSTAGDNLPYLIGFNDSLQPLDDGATFDVPQNVTVMIDAGAVFKMKRSNIDVGSSAQGINRSGGALQVLGTPEHDVIFTSYGNDAIGGDSDGVTPGASPGDWGGLVFRDDSDREISGIFLNYVNHANMTHGGGQVVVGSVASVFTPVHVESARPTISNNRITLSADAAISADPNAFDDSLGRLGPDIHGNTVIDNTINGLFIRIRTQAGSPIDKLTVGAHWDDTDIVHVVAENLHIAGTPGGSLNDIARLDGRLKIDPGIVVKLEGARIEAEVGSSQLIAEGRSTQPIIFTSLKDDEYGFGGTFDTSGDGSATSPAPGQWGGLIFNAVSQGSIDHALIAYGGGRIPIEGDFDQFNAIEVHQADVRLTNSVIRDNAAGTSDGSRNGRGVNAPATIFVRGANPVIVDNVIRDNAAAAVSINANALQWVYYQDPGRSTGPADRFSQFADNRGPLVRLNLMDNNGTNGMVVRPEELTGESVWDDTDIVHVLTGEIVINNHHTYSGLRLQSNELGSLVVKMANASAGFTANGIPLDIDDRIGGTIHVVGLPNFPVVITSIHDDTVGAGFDTNGQPLLDTNNNGSASTPSPGDWRSIRLDRYSNDRNVALFNEVETAFTSGNDVNASPAKAEFLGNLAPNVKSGDDVRRLGFEVHGYISADDPTDVDVYSFNADVGTEVWIDIDLAGSALDTVIELVNQVGTVIASSIDGVFGGSAQDINKQSHLGGDFYTINAFGRDEQMRVVLSGVAGTNGTYFVRVRSRPTTGDENNLNGGQTSGEYKLQIRLQQRDEKPGSTVRYADVRYATTGIEVLGLPAHSPLLGEVGEYAGNNDQPGGAQNMGNLLTSDRNTISVAGSLSNASDVDFYRFELGYDLTQSGPGVNDGVKTWATMFDIDYADGLSRPDTILSVFDANGRLIFSGRDSNIEDDQPAPGQGTDLDDLTRGSVGKLDPYIGSVQMPADVGGNTFVYYVAVSSNARLPQAMNATYTAGALNSQIRLEPVNSVRRVVEDHIGFDGYRSGSPLLGARQIDPETSLFDISTEMALEPHVIPFSLSDVRVFLSTGNQLRTVNADGTDNALVGSLPTGGNAVADLAMRSDGRLFGYRSVANTANTAGQVIEIDTGTAGQTSAGNDSIPDTVLNTNTVHAMAIRRTGVAQYNEVYFAIGDQLFRANPASNSAAVAQNQPWGLRGSMMTGGNVTGMAFLNGTGQLYGVDTNGNFFTINTGNADTTILNTVGGANFAGLAYGPQNADGGAYANMLFAVTTSGVMYAFDAAGNLQPIFNGSNSVNLGVGGVTGIGFAPADFNLWHPTMRRRGDAGHGINATPDNSRENSGGFGRTITSGSTQGSNEGEGGASFYFGLEEWNSNPNRGGSDDYFTYGLNGQLGVKNANFFRDLTEGNPAIGDNYNVPGGAKGSLITNPFDLSGSTATDMATLYFNYFLESEVSDGNTTMRDSARVFIEDDSGTWNLIATNNSALSTVTQLNELPRYISYRENTDANLVTKHPRQGVQELFNNTGVWRQARIDLSPFAGQSNLRLRFDFATSGVPETSLDGGPYGNATDSRRHLNNNFEGFYVDDIIIGFAERGEMVTGAQANQTGYFTVPQNPDFAAPAEVLVGPYQLEIRRGTEYVRDLDPALGIAGNPLSDIAPTVSIDPTLQIDTNEQLIPELGRLGDRNLDREQGHIQIDNNSVSFSSTIGIVVDAGARDAGIASARPGSVRNLPTLNAQRLAPGVTLVNNVVANSGSGGILFSGDPNNGTVSIAHVPFGKIVNNTIYGGATANGFGVQVNQNAGPTLLNNIVANTTTAISVDGTSAANTVVGATLFQGNSTNGTVGTNAIFLAPGAPLFVSPATGNFYPASGSLAVDSSINRLSDRPNIAAVKAAVGIPPSDLFAPDFDRFGQRRLDDPGQNPPPGLGSDIFKDRGAIERADFVGPTARLFTPEDNDGLGIDEDPLANVVFVDNPELLTDFVVQLLDMGIGIDDTLVTSARFELRKNGILLTPGVDYVFTYNANTKRASFTAITGVWDLDNRYSILVDRSVATGLKDLAGNRLQSNRPDGSVLFEITVTDGVNDPPINSVPSPQSVDEDSSLTFSAANGNLISVSDDDAFLGAGTVEVTLTASNGTVTLADSTGVTFSVGDGTDDAVMTFTGLFADVNTVLSDLTFTPTPDYFGPALLEIHTDDLGNAGGDGLPQVDTDVIPITVVAINDDPVNNVPGDQTTNEDQPLFFSSGGGNGISISDVDVDVNVDIVQVTLSVDNGTLTLANLFGLTLITGTGTNDPSVTVQGTVTDINAALEGLIYQPTIDFFGDDTLTITTNDLGATGVGGPLEDVDQVVIHVLEVNKVWISDATPTFEGDGGLTAMTFTVNLRFDPTVDVFVFYSVVDGTAQLADGDYQAQTDFLTFSSGGPLTQDITVFVNGDTKVELDETFNVQITGASVKILDGQGDGTILNDDQATFTVTSNSENEDSGSITFDVTLDNAVDTAVSVDYSTADILGEALAGVDYVATNGTLNFAGLAGETHSFTVTLLADTIVERDEDFEVALSNVQASGRNVIVGPAGTGTIVNDDTASLSINSVADFEASGMLTFTVTLTGDVDQSFTVDFSTADIPGQALAGQDYTATAGTLTFAGTNGEQHTFDVPLIDNTIAELDEQFAVNLTNVQAGGREGSIAIANSGTGTILNDDPSRLYIDDAIVDENAGVITFNVRFEGITANPITVDASTVAIPGGATPGVDYTPVTETLTFSGADGEIQTFSVPLIDDGDIEPWEQFEAVLTNLQAGGQFAEITDGSAIGTIRNDDATLAISSVSQDESAGTMTFTVSLTGQVAPFSVDYATQDLPGQAVAGQDYTPVSGTLNFNGDNGESFDIVVSITDDFVVELDESFELALPAINAGGRNITLAGGNGVGTIVNDDAAVLSIGNAIDFEDAGVLTFEVTLTGQVDEAFTVDFTTTDALLGILAQAGVDYVSLSDSLTFSGASGEVQTIQVTINPDNDIEGDEFFDVLLTAVNAGGRDIFFDDDRGTGTIRNDDAELRISDVQASEGGGTFVFTVTLSGNVPSFSVDFATLDLPGQAVAGDDYAAHSGTLNFFGFDTEAQTVTVEVFSDQVVERDETFGVNLQNVQAPGLNIILADAQGVGTILNDDTAVVSITSNSALEDSGAMTFKVTLNRAVDVPVTVDYATANLPAGSIAIAGDDYTATNGTLTFAGLAGETLTLTVSLTPDTVFEFDEAFSAVISNLQAQGRDVRLGVSSAIGTIVNDDAPAATTLVGPGEPVATMPGDPPRLTDPTPTFEWTPVFGAARYELWVIDNTTNTNPFLRISDIQGTSFTPSSPLPIRRTYQWSVRAISADGKVGPFAPTNRFILGHAQYVEDVTIPVPILTSPVGIATPDTTPTFSWSAVPGADSYDIWVNNLTTGQSAVIREQNIPTNKFTPTTPLPSGFTYQWRVVAVTGGNSSPESAHPTFRIVDAAAPQLLAPVTSTMTQRPTFEWTAVPGAAKYDLWVNNITTNVSGVIRNTNITSTSFTATSDLPAGHLYIWTVAAIFGDGTTGPQASHKIFRIETDAVGKPTLIGPVGGINTNPPVFTWTAVAGAVRYDLWVNNLTTGQSAVIRNTQVNGTSFTGIRLTAGHSYIWTVAAIAADGSVGAQANHQIFSIVASTRESSTLEVPVTIEKPIPQELLEESGAVPYNERQLLADRTRVIAPQQAVVPAEKNAADDVMSAWGAVEWWASNEPSTVVAAIEQEPLPMAPASVPVTVTEEGRQASARRPGLAAGLLSLVAPALWRRNRRFSKDEELES